MEDQNKVYSQQQITQQLLQALKRLTHHADFCGIDCDQASEVLTQAYDAIANAERNG